MAETQALTVYGASDDLVELDGAIVDEFNVYGRPWRGVLTAPDGDSLAITAEFGRLGADADWTLSVENMLPLPGWPIRFGCSPNRPDDPAIIIDVPVGTTIKEIQL